MNKIYRKVFVILSVKLLRPNHRSLLEPKRNSFTHKRQDDFRRKETFKNIALRNTWTWHVTRVSRLRRSTTGWWMCCWCRPPLQLWRTATDNVRLPAQQPRASERPTTQICHDQLWSFGCKRASTPDILRNIHSSNRLHGAPRQMPDLWSQRYRCHTGEVKNCTIVVNSSSYSLLKISLLNFAYSVACKNLSWIYLDEEDALPWCLLPVWSLEPHQKVVTEATWVL